MDDEFFTTGENGVDGFVIGDSVREDKMAESKLGTEWNIPPTSSA